MGKFPYQAPDSLSSHSPSATTRIEHLVSQILVVEFLAIAGTCFLTSVVYFEIVLTQWPSTVQYVIAALAIAVLVLSLSISFGQYVAIQSQSRDRYMWSGIGAVLIAFSLFLSLLFLFKVADWYSRGTFFAQFIGTTAALLAARGIDA